MIQDKIFFDEKDPTGLSYNTPFTFYGSYQGRLWSKSPSGSIQYYTQNSDLSAYATTGSNQFSGSQTITGSLTVTGGVTGTATTASYVEYANVASKPTLVSGSSQVTYSGLTGIPSGIVSGSTQISDFGIFATTGSNGFNGSQSITGSLTVTGQVVAQTLNVQQVTSSIVYSSGSNIFGNDLSNTQQFTGSVGVTGSLTVNGAGTFSSTVTATNGIFINGSNQNTLGSGTLELLTYAGYNSSANQSITLGLAIDEAVDNSRAYQYNLGATGNATGQNLVLTSKRRGTTDLTILTINGTGGAATFSNSVTATQYTATSTGGSGLRIYGAAGTNQWDIYLNSTNLRFSDNTGTGNIVFDRPLNGTSASFTDDVSLSGAKNVRWGLDDGTSNARAWGIRNGYNASGDFVVLSSSTNNTTLNTVQLQIASTGAATFSSSVTAGGTMLSTNTGVDGTFADAFVGRYNSNTAEQNAIQTSVSSVAQSSGFRFQASNGGGSSGRTTVADFLRDRVIFNTGVGIGTSSPDSGLNINSGGTRGLRIDVNSGVQAISISPNGNFGIDEPGVGNGRFIINTSGNVGIGVNTPQTQLHLNGVLTFTEPGFNTVRLNQIASSHSDGNSANNNLRFNVSDGSGTTSERMRINGAGSVGIGSTSITNGTAFGGGGQINRLKVQSTNYTCLEINGSTSGGSIQFTYGTNLPNQVAGLIGYNYASGTVNEFYIGNSLSGNLIFGTSNTERMRITSGGGINTYGPYLSMDGSGLGSTPAGLGHGLFPYASIGLGISSVVGMRFLTGTTPTDRMSIDSSGNIGAPTGTNIYNASDYRLKQNIETISNGLDKISALNPVKFNWIDGFVPSEDGKDMLGFVAQEVYGVIPEAVENFGNNSIVVNDIEIANPLRVNEKFIIPVLVKAIQELSAKVETLEAEIQTLKQQ